MSVTITYQDFITIMKEELIPAFGCTEPIALAYCAAMARKTLGSLPDHVFVKASGNIIKNVKSVIVPNTNGMKGISAAAAAGIVAGDATKKLEVISSLTQIQIADIASFLEKTPIQVSSLDDGEKLDIIITLKRGKETASVRIAGFHTNIVLIEKNGTILFKSESPRHKEGEHSSFSSPKTLLTVENILDFATKVNIFDIKEILDRQISYNTAISEEGLRNSWGANIGSTMLTAFGNNIQNRAKAYAAAGSDARMNGCELPVVINSGSGNQGITVSIPVITYARELGLSKETLYRALTISNLIAIHLKTGIGPLSAYCGAVSAGCAAGCGIAYLYGGDYRVISHTLVNSIAITSGIICDGAKASCAAKIAAAVDAGILGYEMYIRGQQFRAGEGIVEKGVENTIQNVSLLGSQGMYDTDKEIIRIMTK